ncbi:YopX family protein [Streptococcus sp. 202]|uniref:YopX family protein n=3 Tax=unclassified Streptococcus TaxID=2608887 RepID=UPI00156477B8|nr:YopX family protein [Streptococcus sp. 202]
MIPKFRAWLKKEQKMDNEIDHISWLEDELYCIGDGITYMVSAEDLELMQSTGLVDRDGRIIFEGDIVKMSKDVYSEPTYYEVVRHRGGAYRLESKQHGCELWLRHTDCEVVGNIYENRELLEDKE